MCLSRLFRRRKADNEVKPAAAQPVKEVEPAEEVKEPVVPAVEPASVEVKEPVAVQQKAEPKTAGNNPVEVDENGEPIDLSTITTVRRTRTIIITKKATAAQPKPAPEKKEAGAVVRTENGTVLVKVRYNRSHTAKIIQSDDTLKKYYSEIRNHILRYDVKSRISWRHETFTKGRKTLAKLTLRGKTLSLYLALDPAEYEDEYKVENVSSVAKNASVPLLFKIKSDKKVVSAKELIDIVMEDNELEAGKSPAEDYVTLYPYEKTEPLIKRKLIKLLKMKDSGVGAEEGLIELTEEEYAVLTAEEQAEEVAETVEEVVEEVVEEIVEEPVEEVIEEQPVEETYEEVIEEEAPAEEEAAEEPVEEVAEEEPVEEIVEEEPVEEIVEEEPVEEIIEEEPEVEIVESVTVAEAEEKITDEQVEAFVHVSEKLSDKTKKDIVNIDALGRYFKAGEKVTVEQIRKRVPSVNKKATYIKVLARGILDKPLHVEADDFSPAAIKMIVLTGGTVTRTK